MPVNSSVPTGLVVRVYFNLHKRLFSVMSWDTTDTRKGKVIAHVNKIALVNCTFIVQPAGRAKVLSTSQKNVHAFIQGAWAKQSREDSPVATVHYNPYAAPWFTVGGVAAFGASRVEGAVIDRHPSVVSLLS